MALNQVPQTQPKPWRVCSWCDVVLEYEPGRYVKGYKKGKSPVHQYCADQIKGDQWKKAKQLKAKAVTYRLRKKKEKETEEEKEKAAATKKKLEDTQRAVKKKKEAEKKKRLEIEENLKIKIEGAFPDEITKAARSKFISESKPVLQFHEATFAWDTQSHVRTRYINYVVNEIYARLREII